MKNLPKPKDPLGYTRKEIADICKILKINIKSFNNAFGGGNTCAVGKDGTPRFYSCDVERALYTLGNELGKFHLWD